VRRHGQRRRKEAIRASECQKGRKDATAFVLGWVLLIVRNNEISFTAGLNGKGHILHIRGDRKFLNVLPRVLDPVAGHVLLQGD